MKRSAPASSGSDQDKLNVEVPNRSDLIKFVVINIPRINMMTVKVPSDYTVDGIKESIVRELQHREGVPLKRGEFCLTQVDTGSAMRHRLQQSALRHASLSDGQPTRQIDHHGHAGPKMMAPRFTSAV